MRLRGSSDPATKDAHETAPTESYAERLRPFSLRKQFDTASAETCQDKSGIQEPCRIASKRGSSPGPSTQKRFQPPGREDQLALTSPKREDRLQLGSPNPNSQAVAEKLCKRTLQLKAELQACEREATALRQRMSRLGDRSKEKRRAQWERNALHKDWGSGAQTWTTWKAFAERSLHEAQRIRSIIGKVPETDKDLEAANQCTAELLAEVNSELQSAKSEFEEEQVEKTKLTRVLKLCEAECKQRHSRHHAEAESIWAEIAQMERDDDRIRPEELAERKSEKMLRQEVEEQRRRLEACPSKLPNERLQKADEAVDLVCMKISHLQQSQAARQEKNEKAHKKKVQAMRLECEELKEEIGARRAQQAAAQTQATTQAKLRKACAQQKVKMPQEDPGSTGTNIADQIPRPQEISLETQRLNAAKRIQRNVRGWQFRKLLEETDGAQQESEEVGEEQLLLHNTSHQQDAASPRSPTVSSRSVAGGVS